MLKLIDILYTFRNEQRIKIVYRKGDFIEEDRKTVITATKTAYDWREWCWHYVNKARSRLAISVFNRYVWAMKPGNDVVEIWLFNEKDLEDDR